MACCKKNSPEDGRTHYEGKKLNPYHIVARAIRRHSKPWLALTVAEECARRGPDSVPGSLRHVIEASVTLARNAIRDGSGTVPATASSPG